MQFKYDIKAVIHMSKVEEMCHENGMTHTRTKCIDISYANGFLYMKNAK